MPAADLDGVEAIDAGVHQIIHHGVQVAVRMIDDVKAQIVQRAGQFPHAREELAPQKGRREERAGYCRQCLPQSGRCDAGCAAHPAPRRMRILARKAASSQSETSAGSSAIMIGEKLQAGLVVGVVQAHLHQIELVDPIAQPAAAARRASRASPASPASSEPDPSRPAVRSRPAPSRPVPRPSQKGRAEIQVVQRVCVHSKPSSVTSTRSAFGYCTLAVESRASPQARKP